MSKAQKIIDEYKYDLIVQGAELYSNMTVYEMLNKLEKEMLKDELRLLESIIEFCRGGIGYEALTEKNLVPDELKDRIQELKDKIK